MSDEEKNLEKQDQPELTPEPTQEPEKKAKAEVEKTGDVADEKTEKAEAQKTEKAEVEKTAHDDFDWEMTGRRGKTYSAAERQKLLKEYDSTLSAIQESEIVAGKVTGISDGDVILDINYKSDGLVSLSEFRDTPDLAVGDTVDVYVEQTEDERGQLVLSRRKAKLLRAWDMLVDSYENGTIIRGTIISKTKGGLIAECSGLETFLPGSQIDIKPIVDYDAYVGKTMEFRVVKINEAIKNAVVSHKALIESDLAEQREAIISGLEKGQVLEGVVKNITDFGAFMDLGGVDGLLYITDISWGRINHPEEVLSLNDNLNVVVLDFDENKRRISLGLKQLQPHPWDVLPEDLSEGSIVKGKIVNIEDYGAFLEITPGVEGLIHVSEVTWSNQPVNAREYFDLGQEYSAKVVTIDRDEKKMSLSIKQMSKDPWEEIGDKYPVGERFTGEVKNLTPYGVFVELEEGIGGMVHISDLSWTKRYGHPSEFTKVGEQIEVMILEIDKDNRKLSLGHKQLEENPWDTFDNVFPVGSFHEATIIKRDERGAIVQLPYGLEAFAPGKHLKKEDGSNAEVEETLQFKVIEFNRDDKRILVSHSRVWEDVKREAEDSVRKEKTQERQQTRKAVSDQNKKSKVERTTLGELDVFSQLKVQFEEGDQANKDKAKKDASDKKEATDKKAAADKKDVMDKKEATAKEDAAGKKEATDKKEATAKKDAADKKEATDKKEVAEKKAAPAKKKAAKSTGGDDFKKIEGIGPKINELLNEAGINSYAELAKSTPEKIGEILEEAGPRYKMHDPTTWPEQAAMAAKEDWDGLKEWQDKLKGGKE